MIGRRRRSPPQVRRMTLCTRNRLQFQTISGTYRLQIKSLPTNIMIKTTRSNILDITRTMDMTMHIMKVIPGTTLHPPIRKYTYHLRKSRQRKVWERRNEPDLPRSDYFQV